MDKVREVKRLLSNETKEEFNKRVLNQAEDLKNILKNEKYKNNNFSIGLELESYAINTQNSVSEIPQKIKDRGVFAPELGVQNLEINTSPHTFNKKGIREQKKDLKQKLKKTSSLLKRNELSLLMDSLSTNYNSTRDFFFETEKIEDFVFAKNMSEIPRYYAIDNAVLRKQNGSIKFEVPGVNIDSPSILFESLATSIQVHLQIPSPDMFKQYYNTSIRTMAPLLAISTNSPFLPPQLYETGLPNTIWHENRIPIFEQCVNPSREYDEKKVRFPIEIEEFSDLTMAVAQDETYTACLKEWRETSGPHEEFWEWNYKLKEYWRWLRPVIGGESVKYCCSPHSIRIEYRPLPTQPSFKDTIALQMTVAGLIHGLVINNHPITHLKWETSKKDFYDSAKNGLDAELHWITKNGEKTTKKDVIFEEIFEFTEKGLKKVGVNNPEKIIHPIKDRWRKKTTPSKWKIEKVRNKIKNGNSHSKAILDMQNEYIRAYNKFSCFTEWI